MRRSEQLFLDFPVRILQSRSYRDRRLDNRKLRNRDVRYRRNIDAPMTLEQTLMGRSQEREPVQVILVVHFNAFGQTGSWITCDDKADQHTVHIYLVAIRCSPAAEAPAVGKAGIDCRIERNYIARETVGDGNGPVQGDRLDDVYARTVEGRY